MTWKDAVLQVLEQHGGKPVRLQDIYRELWNHPLVTDRHRQPWRAGLQHREGCWIRRCLTTLVREGKAERTGTATYRFVRS